MKDIITSTTDIELAASMLPLLNSENMYKGAVWVRSARLPETMMVAPNSPRDRAKVNTQPEMRPPFIEGRMTLVNI